MDVGEQCVLSPLKPRPCKAAMPHPNQLSSPFPAINTVFKCKRNGGTPTGRWCLLGLPRFAWLKTRLLQVFVRRCQCVHSLDRCTGVSRLIVEDGVVSLWIFYVYAPACPTLVCPTPMPSIKSTLRTVLYEQGIHQKRTGIRVMTEQKIGGNKECHNTLEMR